MGHTMSATPDTPERATAPPRSADRLFDRAFAYAQAHPIGEERFLRMAQGTETIPDEAA